MTDPTAVHPVEERASANSVRPARVVAGDSGGVSVPTRAVPTRRSRGRLATWALGVAMIALSLSWFGAWALPVAALAILLAVIALLARRAQPELAWWALGLGIAAVACCLCWIAWGMQAAAELAVR